MKTSRTEYQKAIETLAGCFPAGSTVYLISRGRSRSGMSQDFSVLALNPNADKNRKEIHQVFSYPNWATGTACGYRNITSAGSFAVRVNGCGFDHGDDIRRSIAHVLHTNNVKGFEGEDYDGKLKYEVL